MARPGVGTQAFEDAGICRAGQYDVGQAQFGGHLGNAANIFRAILRGKPQITVQPVAHIIAIQHITSTALINQLALQRKSKSRLAGGTQARQPECRWALIQQRLALLGGNMAAMPNDGSITFFAQNIPIS